MSTVAFPISVSPVKNKENNALASLPITLQPLDKSAVKGRKRSITLVNGDTVDLAGALPMSCQVAESMRLRILELEDQLTSANTPEPSAKRQRTLKAFDDTVSTSVGSTSAVKSDEKKRKILIKKIFDQLKKECKSDACKFQGSRKTIKIDEIYEQSDFSSVFDGKGHLLQPTPTNKPNSTVHLKQFTTQEQIEAFFGNELKQLKGNRWSRGGIPQRSYGLFGGGGGLSKSVKQGAVDVSIRNIDVNWSKNTLKCSIKFEVAEMGNDSDYYY